MIVKYCKDCVGFDECKTTGRTVEFAVDDGVCIDFDERKPQTNTKRIRSMSDEELENGIRNLSLGYEPWCDHHCKMNGDDDCNRCLRSWLQQPAEIFSK